LLDYFIESDERFPSELYIVVMGMGSYFAKPTFAERIKMAWKVLRTGKYSGGEVLLNETNAATLKSYIGDFLIAAEDD
jgi:hypothetical protein